MKCCVFHKVNCEKKNGTCAHRTGNVGSSWQNDRENSSLIRFAAHAVNTNIATAYNVGYSKSWRVYKLPPITAYREIPGTWYRFAWTQRRTNHTKSRWPLSPFMRLCCRRTLCSEILYLRILFQLISKILFFAHIFNLFPEYRFPATYWKDKRSKYYPLC